MRRLVELEVNYEDGDTPEECHAVAVLRERTPYPPLFRATVEGVVVEQSTVAEERATARISRELIDIEVGIARAFEGSYPWNGPEWLGWSLLPRRAALTFLPGPLRSLAERFIHRAMQAKTQGGVDFRFVIRSSWEGLHWMPWDEFLQRLAPEQEPLTQVACFTRYPKPIESAARFQLPLTIRMSEGQAAIQRYFDPFVLRAIELGAFNVLDTNARDADSEVVHLSTLKDEPWPWNAWPRLIILENHRFWTGTELLREGAGAVLQLDGSSESLQRFLRTFYRKLFHNLPLDQCVREALAPFDEPPRITARLMLREQGEFGLLFTHAAAELQSRTLQAAESRDFLGLGRSPLEAFLSRNFDAAPRAKALTNLFVKSLDSAVTLSLRQSDTQLGQISNLLFQSEEQDLSRLVPLMTGMQKLHRGVEQVEGVLSNWAPQNEDALQESLARVSNVWLHQDGVRAAEDTPILAGHRVSLHVRIEPAKFTESLARLFPDEVLRESFRTDDVLGLDVCVLHEPGTVTVEPPWGRISLRQHGPSTEFQTSLRNITGDSLRLRVCVFHRDQLLQSIVVEADVLQANSAYTRDKGRPAIHTTVDYVASPDLLLLDSLPRPSISLVTNQTTQGKIWLGVFTTPRAGHDGFRTGNVHTLPTQSITTLTRMVREELFKAQQDARGDYRFEKPLDASRQKARARGLVALARLGWRMFDTLFRSNPTLTNEMYEALEKALKAPGLVSIARCNLLEPSIPWALVYDLPLDDGNNEKPPAVCPVFLEQLTAGADKLDDPAACNSQPSCPLKGPEAKTTVCPFGFWGIRHQLDQPLKQVTETSMSQLPKELTRAPFAETCRLNAMPLPTAATMGVGGEISDTVEHFQELKALPGWKLKQLNKRDDVNTALSGPDNLIYLYCHGEVQDSVYKLLFDDGKIASSHLDVRGKTRSLPFLIFLNACESAATLPEVIHEWLSSLIIMGALAVIGTEIEINTLFARPFAKRTLGDVLAGKSLGQAFLDARRHFMRELNPLGLAYTLNAAAHVHLHTDDCKRCRSLSPDATIDDPAAVGDRRVVLTEQPASHDEAPGEEPPARSRTAS